MKTWSIRGRPEIELERILEEKYKEIDAGYQTLRKLEDLQAAQRTIEEIWQMKSFASAIELELMKRGFHDETP